MQASRVILISASILDVPISEHFRVSFIRIYAR
jgi:hypothetical protein